MRIAILTNFRNWGPAYSLTHVVRAQALMLAKYGHTVHVFTMDGSEHDESVTTLPWKFWHRPEIPDYERVNYESLSQLSPDHVAYTTLLSEWLVGVIDSGSYDLIITHDWIFTGPNLPLAEGLRLALSSKSFATKPFLHTIHSVPNFGPCDWWDIRRYITLPGQTHNHILVYHNRTDADQVAHLFYATPEQLRVIPPVVDIRIKMRFAPNIQDVCAILDEMPGLLQADYVQVYPVAADRLKDKGIDALINTFTFLKQRGSVCLLIVDTCTGSLKREDVYRYQRRMERAGFGSHEFRFSSSLLDGKYANGMPEDVLSLLSMCGNLFVYPTKGETFGLPLQEQALFGGVLPVLNRSLSMHGEVGNNQGLYAHFGSCDVPMPVNERDEKTHYTRLANMISARAGQDDCWQKKNFARRSFNMDRVYRSFYEPVFAEMVG